MMSCLPPVKDCWTRSTVVLVASEGVTESQRRVHCAKHSWTAISIRSWKRHCGQVVAVTVAGFCSAPIGWTWRPGVPIQRPRKCHNSGDNGSGAFRLTGLSQGTTWAWETPAPGAPALLWRSSPAHLYHLVGPKRVWKGHKNPHEDRLSSSSILDDSLLSNLLARPCSVGMVEKIGGDANVRLSIFQSEDGSRKRHQRKKPRSKTNAYSFCN